MKRLIASFALITLILNAASAQTDFEAGIQAYNKRAEGAQGLKADKQFIDQAIIHFEKAVEASNQKEKAAIYLLRSYYFKGAFTGVEKSEAKEIYAKGKALGEEMIELYPNNAEIKQWHFVNLGKWSEAYGKMAAAKEGMADQLRVLAEQIIEQDPELDDRCGYRYLGVIHFEAPYIPFFLTWPDNDVARVNMEKALEANPNNVSGNLYYAKLLKDEGDKEAAIGILEKLVKTNPRSNFQLEDKTDIAEARELLNKWK